MGNDTSGNDQEGTTLGLKRFILALILVVGIAVTMLLVIRYAVL